MRTYIFVGILQAVTDVKQAAGFCGFLVECACLKRGISHMLLGTVITWSRYPSSGQLIPEVA